MIVSPCTLVGQQVRLESLELSYAAELLEVALEPELWRFTTRRHGAIRSGSAFSIASGPM
jgi:hypothetical protein